MSNQVDMQASRAEQIAAITARLNRLPPSRYIWQLVMLLSLCGFFEIYEIALTAFLSPGLIRTGVFDAGAKGLFGLADQASFAAATFAGLFMGAALFSSVADKYGRRSVLTYSLLWYSICTVVMAAQGTALTVDVWRLLAGIGVGVQLVTIDSYLAELVPKTVRGRAFAVSYGLMYLGVPTAALLCWLMLPNDPPLMAGWRWVALFAALAVPVVLWVRRLVPESPRWLLQRGQLEAAETVVASIEARVSSDLRGQLPLPQVVAPETEGQGGLAELLRPTYRRRTLMLVALNIFQALGFYGFSNWVPALLASQGVTFVKSLEYSFAIAIVYLVDRALRRPFRGQMADRRRRVWNGRLRPRVRAAIQPRHAGRVRRADHGLEYSPFLFISRVSNDPVSHPHSRPRGGFCLLLQSTGDGTVRICHRDRASRFRYERRLCLHRAVHAGCRDCGWCIWAADARADTRRVLPMTSRSTDTVIYTFRRARWK